MYRPRVRLPSLASICSSWGNFYSPFVSNYDPECRYKYNFHQLLSR
jgi:hypothetical protein